MSIFGNIFEKSKPKQERSQPNDQVISNTDLLKKLKQARESYNGVAAYRNYLNKTLYQNSDNNPGLQSGLSSLNIKEGADKELELARQEIIELERQASARGLKID